jgi:hypothetical protein
MTVKFEVGKTYAVRSAADHTWIIAYTIVRRTDTNVWIERDGEIVRRKLRSYHGVERFDPHGRYSMSPVISADRTEEDVRASDRRTVITHKQELTAPAPRLRPYQQQVADALMSGNRPTLGEHIMQMQQGNTGRTVEALKASCVPVVAAVTDHQHAREFDRATAFLARFCTVDGQARREHIRFVLNVLADMTDDDFAELERIRRYLRGE